MKVGQRYKPFTSNMAAYIRAVDLFICLEVADLAAGLG